MAPTGCPDTTRATELASNRIRSARTAKPCSLTAQAQACRLGGTRARAHTCAESRSRPPTSPQPLPRSLQQLPHTPIYLLLYRKSQGGGEGAEGRTGREVARGGRWAAVGGGGEGRTRHAALAPSTTPATAAGGTSTFTGASRVAPQRGQEQTSTPLSKRLAVQSWAPSGHRVLSFAFMFVASVAVPALPRLASPYPTAPSRAVPAMPESQSRS